MIAFEIKSTNGVTDHYRSLERKGAIRLVGRRLGLMFSHPVTRELRRQVEAPW